MEITIKLLAVALLIALTAFFVASEFAIVKVRTSRINQLIEEGNTAAIAAKRVIGHLDEYLSACQLGITVTALGLGWLGEPTVELILHPMFEKLHLDESITGILSFVIAFASVTFLHVVIGELAPKTVAIQKAEQITLLFSKPLIWFYRIMFPFIWVLNGSARILTGMFGVKSASEQESAHSEEELRIILSESYKSGEINQSEYKYVNKIFEFDNRNANEIMVPRTEVVAIEKGTSLLDVIEIVQQEQFTRYPVIEGDKDNVIGMVNIKRLYTATITEEHVAQLQIDDFIAPVIRVLETIPIHDLLLKMQKERIHMAILTDEYGGTAGLVTVEDILEEIVGEIRDEFDQDERPLIQKIKENHYLFDAKMLIQDVSDMLDIPLPEEDIDTLGGWILTGRYDVAIGDKVEYEGYEFTVKEMDGHHVLYIEANKL
ncbi:hemolysin family protein [Peribacillus psychrosaccharolyticus]|nr:hemolysin family protein [Peribacillus psychrosaccharolyticus]MEC2057836.1 hemolysin family protein [Peribacillus psychrosaccharolyticus]MED3744527.1 hemolysin family protein [Peribacillus psychrosaccharolyticus]